MPIHDDLGQRMKEYEKVSRNFLARRVPVAIRIDGQHFHSFCKGFKRPLLLALDSTPFYTPKKRHLITSEKYEIPNLSNFFFLTQE